MNHFKIPFLNPFKFVPNTSTPGVHFDDAWACEQIRSFQMRATYKTKWQLSDVTKLQIECSIVPDDLKIYNTLRQIVKTIPWTNVFTGIGYSVWELLYDVSDLSEQVVYNYQHVSFGAIEFAAVSEPIDLRVSWPNTRWITYRNSFNDWDVAFSTGIIFGFRCECDVIDFNPERESNDHITSRRGVVKLWGNSWRTFTLYIGEAPGVAPWVVDLFNKILDCDYTTFAGKRYTANQGAKWEVTRIKTWPLIGAKIEVVPVGDEASLEFADVSPLANGLVTAYNIDAGLFGPGAIVPVIDIE